MKPDASPVKKLNIGITESLSVAKQFADEQNIQSFTTPRKGAALAPTTAAQPEAAPTNVTPLPTPAAPTERKTKGPRPSSVRRYSVDLPLYVIEDIHNQAFRKKLTKKQFILEALKKGGLDIKQIDIEAETPTDV